MLAGDPQYHMKKPRNRTKAQMWRESRDGKEIVVKSFHSHPWLYRLYGRVALANEARAYSRLTGVPGIVRCYGLRDKDTLELEHISGSILSSFKRGNVSGEIFDKLERIVTALHQAGVANGDLHRSNVLITEQEDVFLIDFATSLIARDPLHPGILISLLMQLDRYALERLRARYLRRPKPVPAGAFGILYKALSSLKRMRPRSRKAHRGKDSSGGG